jgi:hypothetical protein
MIRMLPIARQYPWQNGLRVLGIGRLVARQRFNPVPPFEPAAGKIAPVERF